MPSTATAPTDSSAAPSHGVLASLRQIGATAVGTARRLAGAVHATASRAVRKVAGKLAIAPTTVLALALVALVIVAFVIARRA